jgi:hypothetical protein
MKISKNDELMFPFFYSALLMAQKSLKRLKFALLDLARLAIKAKLINIFSILMQFR